jgi:hypothetical protein
MYLKPCYDSELARFPELPLTKSPHSIHRPLTHCYIVFLPCAFTVRPAAVASSTDIYHATIPMGSTIIYYHTPFPTFVDFLLPRSSHRAGANTRKVLNSCVGQGWVTALRIIIMEGRGRVSVACVGDIAGGAAGGGT